MAVYYPSNVNCYQQEPIYLNHQQQPSSSSSAAAAAGENFRNEMLFIPPTTGGDVVQNHNPVSSSSELTFGDGRGLSLSLATQISLPSFQYQLGLTSKTPPFSKEMLSGQSHPSSGYAVGDCKSYRYLKPAQSLLEEVVSVKKELNRMRKKQKGQDFNNGSKDTQGGDDSNGISIELSTVERQELQSKKHKLVTMVDEVDKRYNQYYHQMEALASSFEIVAGFGSAKPYTSVALNRISCHFRALRDTIKEQIQMIREKVGEKGGESLDEEQGGERIPRLRYLDQRLRQQRALHQHLGMVRPCWRPQRGLPENSVSALRAWLFEHFLHPYPKESEKMVLAKQTGLSKNQVANWFINARVRLWKPMIEEMYREEFGDAPELLTSKSSQEPNSTNQEDSSSQQQQENTTNDPRQQQQMKRSADYDTLVNYHGFGVDDYRYIGGDNQQHSRFSNGHHLHDFVV